MASPITVIMFKVFIGEVPDHVVGVLPVIDAAFVKTFLLPVIEAYFIIRLPDMITYPS